MPFLVRTILFLVLTGLVLFQPLSGEAHPDEILGVWTTEDKEARIKIYPCGGKYCGVIAWLAEDVYPPGSTAGIEGTPVLDDCNPDPALRNKPLLGAQLLFDFEHVGNDFWKKGRIYDPDHGKTYRASMRLLSPRRLEVRGFIGISFFGSSTIWEKY